MTLATVGLSIGGVIALATVRVLESFLFETNIHDPSMFGFVALILVVAALGASYLPARRATQVDPVEALRSE